MKKLLSLMMAAIMVFGSTVFSVPVLAFRGSNEVVVDLAQLYAEADASSGGEISGLNLWTGTTAAYTFEGATANDFIALGGAALGTDGENSYMEFGGATSHFTLTKAVPAVEKDRPVRVSFKIQADTAEVKSVFLVRNTLNYCSTYLGLFYQTIPTDWTTLTQDVKGADLAASGNSSVFTDDTQDIKQLVFFSQSNNTNNKMRIDDISVVPAYKLTYDLNGGSGSVDSVYFFDSYSALNDGTSLTNGTRTFLGWSLTADGEAVTSVTGTPGRDVTLYAMWSEQAEPEPVAGVRPGLNVFTGTTEAITFDNETENEKIVKANAEIMTVAKGEDTNNKAMAIKGAFSNFYLDVYEIEKDRPVQIGFDYIYGAPFRVIVNNNATIADVNSNSIITIWEGMDAIADWHTAHVQTYYGDAQKNPDKTYYSNNNDITRFYFNSVDLFNSNIYVDNIKVIPGYKINYNANGGNGTAEPDYFMQGTYTDLDNGKTLSGGITKKFAGWSLTKDGEAVTSVTGTPGQDITLYAVWEEVDTSLIWDFETEESRVWHASDTGYSTQYKNGLYIVDTTNGTSSSYIKHNDLTADASNDTDLLRYMVIKARSLDDVSQLKLYFRTTQNPAFSEDQTVLFKDIHTNASVFREYAVDMSQNEYWAGNYINCMLATSAGTGVIEIEEIYFTSDYIFPDDTVKEYQYDLSGNQEYSYFGNTNIKDNKNGTYTVLKSSYDLYPDGTIKYYKCDEATGEIMQPYVSTDENGNPLTAQNGKPLVNYGGAFYTYDVESLSLDSSYYNKLVIKAKNVNGVSGFNVYFSTSDSTQFTGEKMLTTERHQLEDGYTYYVADMSGLNDFVGAGSVKSFMIQPSGNGTVDIHGMYLTNSFSAESEITVEKMILYSTSDKITTDQGTVTVYPYVRYSDGSQADDFSDVYYVTDSVNAQIKRNEDGTATVKGQINGTVGISAVIPSLNARVTKTITIENQTERIPATSLKVSMFGNSILQHGPMPDDGWRGNWGMAASSQEQTYAYRIIHYLNQKYGDNVATIASATNFSTFERKIKDSGTEKDWSTDEDVMDCVNTVKNAQPDIITIQMGENAASDVTVAEYTHATTCFVREMQKAAPDALIVVCTPFWGGENKIEGMKETAKDLDLPIALLHPLGEGPKTSKNENFAFNSPFLLNAGCISEGIMVHPGDVGMDNIAKLIFEQINIKLSENEPTVYTVVPKSLDITTSTGENTISIPYGTLNLKAQILPVEAAQQVGWTVDDEHIGTVSENGVVSAVNNGTLKVTATSKHLSTLSKTIEIVITNQTDPHTVTYDANTTDSVDNMPKEYSYAKENFVIPEIYPEREGYVFLGWSLTFDGEIVDSPLDVKEDITLYALWEKAYRWDFDRTGYREMFTAQNVFNNFVDNGIYQAIATGTNTAAGQVLTINSPKLDIKAEDFKALVIDMANTEFASDTVITLTVFTSESEVTFTKPVTSTQKTVYEFMLEGVTGTITGFKLVPTNVDCTVIIDRIEFAGYNAKTLDIASIRTLAPEGLRFSGFVSRNTAKFFDAEEYGFIVAADKCFTDGDYSKLKFDSEGSAVGIVDGTRYRYLSAAAYVKDRNKNYGQQLTSGQAAEEFTALKSYTLDDGIYFSAAITHISPSNYNEKIAGRIYVKINGEYFYGEPVVRSLYEIAVQYKAQHGENTPQYVENIISTVDNQK